MMSNKSLKFMIEIVNDKCVNVFLPNGEPIEPLSSEDLGKALTERPTIDAGSIPLIFTKSNSGVVIIGGVPYYIP